MRIKNTAQQNGSIMITLHSVQVRFEPLQSNRLGAAERNLLSQATITQ